MATMSKAKKFNDILVTLDARARINDMQPEAYAIYAIAWSIETGRLPTETLKKLEAKREATITKMVHRMVAENVRQNESARWLVQNA